MVRLTAALLVTAGTAGCGAGYKDLPLPGSNVGGDVYQVRAVFDQALNLAQGAQVKVNGVSVGRVKSVEAKDFRAHVTMDIKASAAIPDDSSVRLRHDTPLGELIVQVTPGSSARDLPDGGRFPVRKTTTAPSVEDALSSASTLINGGRVGEIQVIAEELNAAFEGREAEVRATTRRVDRFLQEANQSSGDITRALVALRSVSQALNSQRGTIRRALRDVGPAAETLGKDTDEIVDLLVGAERLSRTAERLAERVDDPLLRILRQLGPIADAVLSTKSEFRRGLDSLVAVAEQMETTVPSETLPLRALLHIDETQLYPAAAAPGPPQVATRAGVGNLSKTLEDVTGRLNAPLGQLPLLHGLDLTGGRR
jgi:phospholipid/cholesterol/gamma-HCH transport system substrate-binding protein